MRSKTALLTGLVVLALVLSGCGPESSDSTTTIDEPASTTSTPVTSTTMPMTTSTAASTTTTATSPEEGLVVYFLLDELEEEAGGPFLVPVYRDEAASDTPEAVMESLVTGPTEDERSGTPSISTAIPDGTLINGVDVEGALARVDLSGEFDDGGGSFSMFARLAQVVYTVTRIDGIDQVEFLVDGEPVTVFSSEGIEIDGTQERSDYYDQLPPIFVDYPAWGQPVTSPIAAGGLSNVFEAVSQVMLTDDDGLPLFEDTVMATCGTGCWGEWEAEIPYIVDRDQFGALIVWEFSAKDGSRINVREYPVQLR